MSSAVNTLNNGAQSLNHNQDHLGSTLTQNISNSTSISPNAKGANHNPPVSLHGTEKTAAVNPVTVNKTPEKEVEGSKVAETHNGTQEPVAVNKSENNSEVSQQSSSPVKPAMDEKATPENNSNASAETPKANTESPEKPASQIEQTSEPVKKEANKEENSQKPISDNVEKPKETPVKEQSPEKKVETTSPVKTPNADIKSSPVEKKVDEKTSNVSEKPEDKPKVDTEKSSIEQPPKPENAVKEDKTEVKETKPNEEKKADDKKITEKTEKEASPVKAPEKVADETSPNKKPLAVTPTQKKTEVKQKSTLKLATVTPNISRKRKKEVPTPQLVGGEGHSPPKRTPRKEKASPAADDDSQKEDSNSNVDPLEIADGRSSKRNRTKVQPYQVPTPELAMLTKLSVNPERSTPTKQAEDKLIVFYKNEFLAVRNAEGSFYVCQTTQNVYKSTRKIKIRWLSQDKTADPNGEIYKPDFYDTTDIDCVLTTLSLQRASSGWKLGAAELARTQNILGRALAAERGEPTPDTSVTEEHPDGLDLSLYKDESQLEKKKNSGTPSRKRKHSKSKTDEISSPAKSSKTDDEEDSDDKKEPSSATKKTPAKSRRSVATPKKTPSKKGAKATTKTPKSKKKSKTSAKVSSGPKDTASSTKVGVISRIYKNTATPTGKTSPLVTPKAKKTPAKAATPSTSKGKTPKVTPSKAAQAKAAQLASTPSTSTGKATRSPRKPPSKK